jgi:hypothetical protein
MLNLLVQRRIKEEKGEDGLEFAHGPWLTQ